MEINIEQIAKDCVVQQKTLTPQRLRILKNISECIEPISAYGLKSRVDASGPELNISTIYRVLEFWIKLGIVHKVDSTKTYFICQNRQNKGPHIIQHCISCDGILEHTITMKHLTTSDDFCFAPVADQVIELKGKCKNCLAIKESPE